MYRVKWLSMLFVRYWGRSPKDQRVSRSQVGRGTKISAKLKLLRSVINGWVVQKMIFSYTNNVLIGKAPTKRYIFLKGGCHPTGKQ